MDGFGFAVASQMVRLFRTRINTLPLYTARCISRFFHCAFTTSNDLPDALVTPAQVVSVVTQVDIRQIVDVNYTNLKFTKVGERFSVTQSTSLQNRRG